MRHADPGHGTRAPSLRQASLSRDGRSLARPVEVDRPWPDCAVYVCCGGAPPHALEDRGRRDSVLPSARDWVRAVVWSAADGAFYGVDVWLVMDRIVERLIVYTPPPSPWVGVAGGVEPPESGVVMVVACGSAWCLDGRCAGGGSGWRARVRCWWRRGRMDWICGSVLVNAVFGWRSGDWVDTWLVSGGRVRVVFQVDLLGQNPGVYLGQHQSGNKCVRLVRIRGLSLARYRVGDPVWNRGGHHYWDTATRRVGGTAP